MLSDKPLASHIEYLEKLEELIDNKPEGVSIFSVIATQNDINETFYRKWIFSNGASAIISSAISETLIRHIGIRKIILAAVKSYARRKRLFFLDLFLKIQ